MPYQHNKQTIKYKQNNFYDYLERLDETDPIDCIGIIADLSTRLLLGKGITFDSKNTNITDA
jgi:hypothetical protein